MSRKVPTQLEERITFMENLMRSAQMTMAGFEMRLAELDKERAAIDAREASLRKDNDTAPAMMERAQKELNGLLSARRQILHPAGPRGADPRKREERLRKKVERRNRLMAQLAEAEAALEEEGS